MELRIIL